MPRPSEPGTGASWPPSSPPRRPRTSRRTPDRSPGRRPFPASGPPSPPRRRPPRPAGRGRSVVVQLLVPIGPPFRGEVEEVPEGLDRPHVARVLAGIPRRVEEFGAPEVPDRVALAMEHVEHRPLCTLGGLRAVV